MTLHRQPAAYIIAALGAIFAAVGLRANAPHGPACPSDDLAVLTASDAAVGSDFGRSVAVSSNFLLVGAPFDAERGSSAGAAYLFDVATGRELYKLTASDGATDDWFGWSVAICGDRALIGARRDSHSGGLAAGSAYLFDIKSGKQLMKLTASDASPSADLDARIQRQRGPLRATD